MDTVSITDVTKLINDWQTLGVLAAAIATLQLLVKVLKLKTIDDQFTKRGIKWVKPYITVGLGVLLGGLSTYATGAGVPQSIVAGAIAGTTSVGWNEILNKLQLEKRLK